MTDTSSPAAIAWRESVQSLDSAELTMLGTLVRDLHLRLDPHSLNDPGVALLFREAISEAISQVTGGHQTRKRLERDGFYQQHGMDPPEPLPITPEDVARTSMDHAFGDGFSPDPSFGEQWARIHFARTLDPTCEETYLIEGSIEEAAGHLERARVAYEQAMHLAASRLGEDAFSEEARREERIHFWGAIETRTYMRARAALGMTLWRQGALREAVAHFAALIDLNPNDNQGNRDLLLCCLLELGDDTHLGRALRKHRYYHFDSGKEENREPVWWYTYAAWLFRTQATASGKRAKEEATEVLQKAFLLNRYVPMMLLDPSGLPTLDKLSGYSRGSPTEAATYVSMALKGWQHSSGALAWLETRARTQGLLPANAGGSPFGKLTIVLRPPRKPAPLWWPDPYPPQLSKSRRRREE